MRWRCYTHVDNAIGYAESRNGKICVFDISEASEIFQPSEVHLQIRHPKEAKLVAICEPTLEKCYCYKTKIRKPKY